MTDKPTIPEGWREMAPDEPVIKGDQCYGHGRFEPSINWQPGHSGKQIAQCRPYIRRIEQCDRPIPPPGYESLPEGTVPKKWDIIWRRSKRDWFLWCDHLFPEWCKGMPIARRIEQPQSAWISVNPALGGRLPTEADGIEASKDGGKCVLVEDRFGQLKVVPWNAAGFDNGYLPNGASFVRWHRLPDPYVPPEPEKRDHRIIKDGGIERRYVEERDGDPDPDAARELVEYMEKHQSLLTVQLRQLVAKCRRTDDA